MVYGQSDEFPTNEITDEFELTDPAFEVNSSQEEIGGDPLSNEPSIVEEMSRPEPAPQNTGKTQSTSDSEPFAIPVEDSNATTAESFNSDNENTVLVREKQMAVQNLDGDDITSVEVRSARDIFLPYKQRQDKWGFAISLGAEFMTFPDLISRYDTNTYEDLFGSEPASMHSIELGPKYNTDFGSFGLYGAYGKLSIASSRIGAEATLDITRYSATVVYYVDTIWEEPYFVPYFGGGVWQADYKETSESEPDNSIHYTTDIGYHWRVGGLIGLDWLEPNTALRSRRFIGLQGTFINIYATSSYMAESNPDPDLQSEMDFGASLMLEF